MCNHIELLDTYRVSSLSRYGAQEVRVRQVEEVKVRAAWMRLSLPQELETANANRLQRGKSHVGAMALWAERGLLS